MSTEQDEKRDYLVYLESRMAGRSAFERADYLLANGVDVTVPEPQWKPGQVVRLRLGDGMPYLAKRVDSNDGWEVFGVDVLITDDEVTDIEPVAVLTAEDVRELFVASRAHDAATQINVRDFFRERGLDL